MLIAHNLIFLCFFPSVWYRKWDKNLLLSAEKPAPLFNIMQRSFYVMEVIRKSGNRLIHQLIFHKMVDNKKDH